MDNLEIKLSFPEKQLLSKLILAYNYLIQEMKKVSERILEISYIYKTLYDYSIQNLDNEKLSENYKIMESLMLNWSYSEL